MKYTTSSQVIFKEDCIDNSDENVKKVEISKSHNIWNKN